MENKAEEKSVPSSDLLAAWWEIPHPGTAKPITCVTFTEAMDVWFEGWNIPVLVIDGVREDFSKANKRVRKYYSSPNTGRNGASSRPFGDTGSETHQ